MPAPKTKDEAAAPPVNAYQLLESIHIGPDLRADPDPATGKFPSRRYTKGQRVISDVDLVALCGHQKFRLIGEAKGDEAATYKAYQEYRAEFKTFAAKAARARQAAKVGAETPRYAGGNPAGGPTFDRTVKGAPTEQNAGAAAPGGQVSDGFQEAALGGNSPAGGGESEAVDYDAKYGQLEDKTVAELKEIAEENEIELGDAHKKAEIIEAIRAGGSA